MEKGTRIHAFKLTPTQSDSGTLPACVMEL